METIKEQLSVSNPQLPNAEPVYLMELSLMADQYKHVKMEQRHTVCLSKSSVLSLNINIEMVCKSN